MAQLTDRKMFVAASKSGINKALTPVVRSARQNVPKGTTPHKTYKGRIVSPGFASRNIGKSVKQLGDKVSGIVGAKGEAFYALFLETGTKYMQKQPWLVKSFDENKEQAVAKFGDGIQAYITRIAKKK